jgi:hypothetical protein
MTIHPTSNTFAYHDGKSAHVGLSQRDYVAVQIATALVARGEPQDSPNPNDFDSMAAKAYAMADALIRASGGGKPRLPDILG